MRNLLLFQGSCGHTTVDEVSDEVFEQVAARANRVCVGKRTRAVYVWPRRFMICQRCMQVEAMAEANA